MPRLRTDVVPVVGSGVTRAKQFSMAAPQSPEPISIDDLVFRYQVILCDAYGVLVDGAGALPGADGILRAIRAHRRELLVVTNDASRSAASVAARFASLGLAIPADRIITSGTLIAPYLATRDLGEARCMVLGPDDSAAYVRAAGGRIVPVSADSDIDALIICDDGGYPFLDGVEAALNAVARQLARGREVALVLPNPDLIFPKAAGLYGYTAGAIALLIEAGLARLYPDRAAAADGGGIRFARLGKPHLPIFERARELGGTDSLVMIGDQLQTDIAGANAAGIASALVATGVSKWRPDAASNLAVRPDFLLSM